ncbi:hypothetical protein CsatA_013979 [Cannabis sativa]
MKDPTNPKSFEARTYLRKPSSHSITFIIILSVRTEKRREENRRDGEQAKTGADEGPENPSSCRSRTQRSFFYSVCCVSQEGQPLFSHINPKGNGFRAKASG